MKKRKILYLFPLTALLLAGCSFQEGYDKAKGFLDDKIINPILSIFGLKDKKQEDEQKDPEEATLSSVAFKSGPKSVRVGEEVDPSSVKLTATYSDDSSKEVAAEKVTVDTSKAGENVPGVAEYKGKTARFTINVVETPATEHAGTAEDPFSGADACAIGSELEDNAYSDQAYYVKGVVQTIDDVFDANYGNYSFTIEDGFKGYRMKKQNNTNFNEGDVAEGDIVIMFGKIKKYGEKYELDGTKNGGAYVVSVERPAPTEAELTSLSIEGNVKTEYVVGEKFAHEGLSVTAHYADEKTQDVTAFVEWSYSKEAAAKGDTSITITASYKGKTASLEVQITVSDAHAGTEDDPLNGAEASAIAAGLASGSYSEKEYYVKGVVQSIDEAYSSEYGNYSFTIEDGFKGYRMKKQNNTNFNEGDVAVGYTVLMCGKIKNYNGTYELDGTKNGGAYVVSVTQEVIEVESVSLSQDNIAMEVDDLVTLEAYVYPNNANQKVNWSVDQEGDIVSFDKDTGVITALSVGSATITATSVENANAHASCSITVSEKTKVLTDIEVGTTNVKTQYNVGEPYSTEGIVVTAKYSNAEDQDVTAGATITCDKQTATAGDEQLTITVSYGGIEKVIVLAVQVTAKSSLQTAYEGAIAGETGAFTFEGTVVSVTGKSYVLQDGDYAINIYNKETEGVALNKLVQVVSTLKLYQGCPQTDTITSATVTGEGVAQTSASVTNKEALDALNHNVLAHVDDAVFVSDNGDWASGATKQFVFAIGGDNITVSFDKQGYDAAKAAIANAAIAGDHFELTGLITAAYSGTNQLTFTGTSGIVKTSSAPVPDPATVTITSGNSLAVGLSMNLTATVGPDGASQDVEWSIVSGGDHATLSNGVLTGVSAGDVVVQATAVGFASVNAQKTINIFETPSDSVTRTFKAEDLIEDPSAAYSGGTVKLTSHAIDEVLTVSVTGGSNSGKVYKSNDYGFQIRLYDSSNDKGVLTVTAAEGYEIISATASSADGSSTWWGAPSDVEMTIASGGQSASIQGKITVYSITVVYQPAQ